VSKGRLRIPASLFIPPVVALPGIWGSHLHSKKQGERGVFQEKTQICKINKKGYFFKNFCFLKIRVYFQEDGHVLGY